MRPFDVVVLLLPRPIIAHLCLNQDLQTKRKIFFENVVTFTKDLLTHKLKSSIEREVESGHAWCGNGAQTFEVYTGTVFLPPTTVRERGDLKKHSTVQTIDPSSQGAKVTDQPHPHPYIVMDDPPSTIVI